MVENIEISLKIKKNYLLSWFLWISTIGRYITPSVNGIEIAGAEAEVDLNSS